VPQVRPRQDARAKVNLETIALLYNRGHNGRLLSFLLVGGDEALLSYQGRRNPRVGG